MPNPVSSANFFGHPIHPMLVLFPVAFFVATFASDLGFWHSGNAMWVTAGLWLLGAGLVMAALARSQALLISSATRESAISATRGSMRSATSWRC